MENKNTEPTAEKSAEGFKELLEATGVENPTAYEYLARPMGINSSDDFRKLAKTILDEGQK